MQNQSTLVGGLKTDARSDIYSLGGMTFHGLSGQHPATVQTQPDAPPALRQLLPEIPESLDQLVSRCLATDPAARFSSVAEILAVARSLRP